MKSAEEMEEEEEEEIKGELIEDTIGEYEGGRNDDNERHGAGRTILPNGDYYEGQYHKNLRHGVGLYVFMKSGARYSGQYFNGKKQGIGTFYYPDGSIYEGEWKEDMKHGYGIYMYANGDVYEGQWYKDVKEGIGYYKYKQIPCKYLGTWKNGIMEGPGQRITNNYRYHGTWRNNLPYGKGCFTFNNESMLHGFYFHKEKEPDDDDEIVKGGDGDAGQDKKRPTVPVWRSRELTKYMPERLPPEPRPFEYPESETSRSPTPSTQLEAPYQHEIFKSIAKFDGIYIDEKKLTEVDSWENEVFDCDAELEKLKKDECPPHLEKKISKPSSEDSIL